MASAVMKYSFALTPSSRHSGERVGERGESRSTSRIVRFTDRSRSLRTDVSTTPSAPCPSPPPSPRSTGVPERGSALFSLPQPVDPALDRLPVRVHLRQLLLTRLRQLVILPRRACGRFFDVGGNEPFAVQAA